VNNQTCSMPHTPITEQVAVTFAPGALDNVVSGTHHQMRQVARAITGRIARFVIGRDGDALRPLSDGLELDSFRAVLPAADALAPAWLLKTQRDAVHEDGTLGLRVLGVEPTILRAGSSLIEEETYAIETFYPDSRSYFGVVCSARAKAALRDLIGREDAPTAIAHALVELPREERDTWVGPESAVTRLRGSGSFGAAEVKLEGVRSVQVWYEQLESLTVDSRTLLITQVS
jgi:hypothetical protein